MSILAGRLGSDAVCYGLSTFLVRGLQIILIPIYTRLLSSADYGVIDTITIAAALVNLTVALEIAQGMARFIADAKDDSASRSVATTAVAFALLAYSAFTIIAGLFSGPIAGLLFEGTVSQPVLLTAIVAIAVNGMFVMLQDLLRWRLRPRIFALASLSYALGSAGISIWLVSVAGWGVTGVFAGQLAGAMSGGAVALIGASGMLQGRLDTSLLKKMLAYSLPLVLSGLAVFGNLFVDRMVIRSELGLEALGIYSVAARFASTISILAVGLQIALSPLIYRYWQQPGTANTLARVARLYCAAMVPVVGGLSLFTPEMLFILTGPAFHDGAGVLPLLAFGAMLATLYMFAPGLFLGKRTHYVAWLNMGGVAVNLTLSVVLVRAIGAAGAAAAMATASAFILAGYVLFGDRWFHVPYQVARISVSMMLVAATVLLATFQNSLVTEFEIAGIAGRGGILIIACLIAFYGGLDRSDRTLLLTRFRALRDGSPRV